MVTSRAVIRCARPSHMCLVLLIMTEHAHQYAFCSLPFCSLTSLPDANLCSYDVPSAEAKSSLRFDLVPEGKGQAIVVLEVAKGSTAEQVSSPSNPSESVFRVRARLKSANG